MTEATQILEELNKRLEWEPRNNVEANKITGGEVRHLNHIPRIKCRDGLVMSVQASTFHYCAPRDSFGPWSAVEVGFPSSRVEQFMPYIDGGPDTDPLTTVYGFVPIETVAEVIAEHGGFAD